MSLQAQEQVAPPLTADPPQGSRTPSEFSRQFKSEFSLLQTAARQARAKGETAISIGPINHIPEPLTIRDIVFSDDAVIVGLARRVSAAQSVTPMVIATWHAFSVEQSIARGKPAESCIEKPPGLRREAIELFVPVYGGTTTIDGVSVTLTGGSRLPWREGGRYLLIGPPCGDDVVLAAGRFSAWEVTGDGEVVTSPGQESVVRRVPELRSITALRSYVHGTEATDLR